MNVKFATTISPGDMAIMCKGLVRSIKEHHPESEIHVFSTSSEFKEVRGSTKEWIKENATVSTGDPPIPGYKIGSQLKALKLACEEAEDGEGVVMLDTDTILLSKLPIQDLGPGEVFARPASIGVNFWSSPRSNGRWKEIYSKLAEDRTNGRLVSSPLDNKLMYNYFNSGVVVTFDYSLGKDLLETTRRVFQLVDREPFFSDQIALSVETLRRDVGVLGEEWNYPLLGHIRIPGSVKVLHYGHFGRLTRVAERSVRSKAHDYGLPTDRYMSSVYSLIELVSSRRGLLVP